jgi:Tol biopolymer transport system component
MCNLKWSPDGKSIAFDARGAIGSAPSVWVVNSDGTNPHPVSGNCAGAVCSGTSWGDPFWSPDGSILGFSRMYATNAVRLYRMSGGQVTDLTLGGASIHLDGWSPSGTKLLYETVDASDNGQALGVMATDGGFPVTFSPDTALFMPSWRP